ncbi:MAG: c-type cytochrome biogenesis protein CcmF, partial [Salinisphaera sp.]|nr:c-type cytochrome biogenesis protein CcmF [Salinisphaera sp.]
SLSWLTLGVGGVAASAGCVLGFWAIATAAEELWRRRRGSFPRGVLGMCAAHSGVGITVIGITLVSAFGIDRNVSLDVNEAVTVAGYQFTFLGTTEHQGPNYLADVGRVRVRRDGEPVALLLPAKRRYASSGSVMTESGIDIGVFRDLYVALGKPLQNGGWSLRIFYRPFVRWIWVGGLFMMLGGLLAATDPRYRRLRAKERQQAPTLTPGAVQA